MNKFIYLKKMKSEQGFTLIELLVVVMIISILAAIALPNTIKQAAKARETEGKSNLGILSRAQQAYHFETTIFSSSISDLLSNAAIDSKYFTFPNPSTVSDSIVKHQAIAIDPSKDQVRNYATGVYFNAGIYDVVFCQGSEVTATVDAPNIISDSCTNGGDRIR